jgi:hypothetical protein
MIVTSTPLEYAKSRLAFWQKRLQTADETAVGRRAGCFPSQEMKRREQRVCVGAIAALKEVTEATYATAGGRLGTKAKNETSDRPEILPPAARS